MICLAEDNLFVFSSQKHVASKQLLEALGSNLISIMSKLWDLRPFSLTGPQVP